MNKILFSILWLCLTCLTANVYAQNSNAPKQITNTYLFTNATIIKEAGNEISNADILIKDGLIVKIGKSINPPFDAKIVEADSMFIYPAFIDAGSHNGFKTPKPKDLDKGHTDNPTLEQSGITPQISVRDHFSSSALKSKKEAGIGYVQVIPEGKMLAGKGSIVTTGSGTFAEKVILEDNVAYGTFKKARKYFPSTTMGVMKMYRDVFANTKNAKSYISKYNRSPLGLQKPQSIEEYEALFPVVEGKTPLLFKASKPKAILRALKLQKELGFKTILFDVKQITPIIKQLKNARVPLILSLDIPEKIDEKEAEGDIKPDLFERKKKSYETYITQAKLLSDNNIDFAFTIGEADIKKTLNTLIDAGLSEEDALAALTTQPAKILGIDNIAGSLKKGKIANLFVTDKPYFDEKSKIRYTLIDGELIKVKIKASGKPTKDYSGTYSYNIEIPGNSRSGNIKINKSGDSFEVKISNSENPNEFTDGSDVVSNENNLTFNMALPEMGITVKYDIKFEEDDSFSGTVSVAEYGSFPVNGKLLNKPE